MCRSSDIDARSGHRSAGSNLDCRGPPCREEPAMDSASASSAAERSAPNVRSRSVLAAASTVRCRRMSQGARCRPARLRSSPRPERYEIEMLRPEHRLDAVSEHPHARVAARATRPARSAATAVSIVNGRSPARRPDARGFGDRPAQPHPGGWAHQLGALTRPGPATCPNRSGATRSEIVPCSRQLLGHGVRRLSSRLPASLSIATPSRSAGSLSRSGASDRVADPRSVADGRQRPLDLRDRQRAR